MQSSEDLKELINVVHDSYEENSPHDEREEDPLPKYSRNKRQDTYPSAGKPNNSFEESNMNSSLQYINRVGGGQEFVD
jgi:hypothetical protein